MPSSSILYVGFAKKRVAVGIGDKFNKHEQQCGTAFESGKSNQSELYGKDDWLVEADMCIGGVEQVSEEN